MIYVFDSATGPRVTYTGAVGDEILRAAGRNPGPRGVIPAAEIDEVLGRLAAAVAREAAAERAPPAPALTEDDGEEESPAPVSLARRIVPLVDLLERARAQGKDVTWGI